MQLSVSFWLSLLPLLFFSILVHRIHTYQGYLWTSFKLPTLALGIPLLVSSPGAEYMASRWCDRIPVTIGSHVFPSDLIILESQGLDVILSMDWMSKYGGSIDFVSKSICLTTPKGK